MLEYTEGAIKNGQSRETVYIRRRKLKKNPPQYVLDTTRRKQTQLTKTRHTRIVSGPELLIYNKFVFIITLIA